MQIRGDIFSIQKKQIPIQSNMEQSNPYGEKKVFRFGIRQKLIASFILSYAVLTGSFLYMIVVNLHRLAEEEVINAARYRATYISAVVSGHLAGTDRGFLAEFLEKVLKEGEVTQGFRDDQGGERPDRHL